jgi:hypothetical protein
MNYNFKKDWHKIKPFLQTKKMKNVIKKGIKWWLKNCEERYRRDYDETLYPYDYGLGDGYYYFEYEYNELPYILIEKGILKEEPLIEDYETDEEYDNACKEFEKEHGYYEDYRSKICEPYVKEYRENSYQTYCIYRGCFWWNTTFGIELAKLVMPNVDWVIKQSDIHASVVSRDNSLVFDILYFDSRDKTLGGKKAIHDVYNEICWHTHHMLLERISELKGYCTSKKDENKSKEQRNKIALRLAYIRDYTYYQPPNCKAEVVFENE